MSTAMRGVGRVPVGREWTQVGGWTVHARRAGPASGSRHAPVVLVHGLGVSSRYMVRTAELLGSDREVLAPDLPGFGRSTKPAHVLTIPELADALAAWLRARGLQRPVLLGNSLGCQIVVELAVRYPDALRAAVLVGPTVDPLLRSVTSQLAALLLDAFREPPALLPIAALDYLTCGVRRMIGTFRHALADEIGRKLPHVRVPTLVVRGARDPLVTQGWAEEVARLLPRGRLIVVPRAAHAVNFKTPVALTRVVRAFADEMTS